MDECPELEPRINHAFLKAFVRKEEVVRLENQLNEFREKTRDNFEEVNKHLDSADDRMNHMDRRFDGIDARLDGIDDRLDGIDGKIYQFHRTLTSIGARWGIYNEDVIRQMIASLIEETYGAKVEHKVIDGEEFDVVISNGDHILIEVTARAKSNIQRRLERKRAIYIDNTGVEPSRFILAVGSIHSTRAQALREAGFEVVEPSEDLEEWED